MEKVHKLVFMLISNINRNLFKEFSITYVIFVALKTNSGFSIRSYIIMFPSGVLKYDLLCTVFVSVIYTVLCGEERLKGYSVLHF